MTASSLECRRDCLARSERQAAGNRIAAVIVADACEGEGEEHAWRVLRHSVCLRIAEERQALDAIRASLGTTGTRPNS